MRKLFAVIVVFACFFLAASALVNSQQPAAVSASVVGLRASDSSAGFARATSVRTFKFPDDHGPHPEFQTEWWYYTGNLDARDGRRFGYQLTFFRRAITPTLPTRVSDWATNQIYFAHFAITDVKNNAHAASEHFSRDAAGLAGATGNPFHVWLEDRDATALDAPGNHVQLHARDEKRGLDLTLTSLKSLVLQGDRGLSQKSAEAGNASYYYSFTRLETTGTITVNDEPLTVSGTSWMDHEWSTAVLGENAVGWDWFSIQLSDNREVMLFQIRQKNGSVEPLSSGTIVEPDGTTRHLTREQFDIKVLSSWTSNTTHATYPSHWTIAIPDEDIHLDLQPLVADQEMDVSIKYWEGAVNISGLARGATVNGRGFVEMTGYAPQVPVNSKK